MYFKVFSSSPVYDDDPEAADMKKNKLLISSYVRRGVLTSIPQGRQLRRALSLLINLSPTIYGVISQREDLRRLKFMTRLVR